MSLAMEALAVNYMAHGVLTAVNNVWAWIAFLTAAISFWKLKSSIHGHPSPLLLSSPPPPPSSTSLPSSSTSTSTSTVVDRKELPSTTTPSFTSSKRFTTFCTLENRRSGKFSVYYPQDFAGSKKGGSFSSGERRVGGLINEEEERLMVGSIRPRRRFNYHCEYEQAVGWEAVLKMKTSEMEWYSYQDLTVLNGNVVRLWNEIAA